MGNDDAHQPLVLGVDGGGSKSEIGVARRDESGKLQIIARATGPGTNPHTVGFDTAVSTLQRLVTQVQHAHSIQAGAIRSACLCLAGVDRSADRQRVHAWWHESFPSIPCIVANDANLLLAAAIPTDTPPLRPISGIALVAGTGSIAWGQRDRQTARSGGWGYLAGDEGSGTWLGRELLNLTFRAADRRTAATDVVPHVLQSAGVGTVEELVPWLYDQTQHPRAQMASLAPLAFQLETHPEVAALIQRGAEELAGLVIAVARQLDFTGNDYLLALSGSVLARQPGYAARVLNRLEKDGMSPGEVRVVEDPLRGALRLASWAIKRPAWLAEQY